MLTKVQHNFLNSIIDEVVFRNTDVEEFLDLVLFLGGKNIFYKLAQVDDQHTKVYRVVDEETIDDMEEDLECLWLFTEFTDTETKVAKKLKDLLVSDMKYLCLFMTQDAIKNVRWDLMAYVYDDFEFTVLLKKGVVEIKRNGTTELEIFKNKYWAMTVDY